MKHALGLLLLSGCSLLNEPRFACDPLARESSQCDAYEKCAVAENPQITECRRSGDRAFDDVCRPDGSSADCRSGWTCIEKRTESTGWQGRCRAICRIGGNSDCERAGPEHVCIAPNTDLARYGFCCPKEGC